MYLTKYKVSKEGGRYLNKRSVETPCKQSISIADRLWLRRDGALATVAFGLLRLL